MVEVRETTLRVVKQKPNADWAYAQTTDQGPWHGYMGKGMTPGTWIKAEGEWVTEKPYPRAFKIRRVIQVVRKEDDVGMSWMVWRLPEIGDVRAKALSEQYGDSLPDMLESSRATEALAALRGLTPARIQKILRTYADFPGELRLAMWLGRPNPAVRFGLGWAEIKAALEHYNDVEGLREAVEADPFDSLMEVKGITYRAVVPLSEALGLEENDPRRLRAWIWERLDDLAGGSGDTYMPHAEVLKEVAFGRYQPNEVFEILNQSKRFHLLKSGAQLVDYIQFESSIAERTHRMLENNAQQELELDDIPTHSSKGFELDASQRKAILRVLQCPVCILTGGPGTGKTTVLRTALELMDKGSQRYKLASPTGKAAKRMTEATGRKATTVHRLLEWRPPPDGFKRNATNPIQADVVVVDEASMLDDMMAASLFEAIGEGTRLILVGDVNQLPPVGAGQPMLDLLNSGVIPVYRLETSHRTGKDSWVIDNAPRILQGMLPSLRKQDDFEFVSVPHDQNNPKLASDSIIQSVIGIYRAAREMGPEAEKQLQVLTAENNNGAGTVALNMQVQRALNPAASSSRFEDESVKGKLDVRISVNDKVFYNSNTVVEGLVNGSMGIVEDIEITANETLARVRFDGDENPETGDDLFTLRDAEIKEMSLAYAMTVHKAQGSEWGHVVVVVDPVQYSMRRKLLYTAITRTSKNLLILGTEAAVARGAKNNPDENRATLLQQRLRGEQV